MECRTEEHNLRGVQTTDQIIQNRTRGTYMHTPRVSDERHSHFPLVQSSPFGQCWKGGCLYPMSRKKCSCSLGAKRAAAMECTGASPQRWMYVRHSRTSREIVACIPRSKILLLRLESRRTSDKLQISRSPCRRSRSCSRLIMQDRKPIAMPRGTTIRWTKNIQWHRLYVFPPSSLK